MSDTTLALAKISHRYGESAWTLSVESFTIGTGTLLGIIGPNGSGKSTLLRIAAGVLTPDAGDVRLGGESLPALERRMVARRLGYLPQEISCLFDYTVEEVARMGRFPHAPAFGSLGAKDLEVVERCLERTEMAAFRARPLSHLSGGERKRALLASALAQEPEILLLDEPTAALDVHHQVSFFQIVRDLAHAGMGIAVVTHDINLAALFCDRLILMQAGGFVAEGPPAEVLDENRLKSVYGPEVMLTFHPEGGSPLVLPRRSRGGDA